MRRSRSACLCMPAPADVDDAIGQMGAAASLALDAGPLDDSALPSTIVDVSGGSPRVVRLGAIGIDELGRACPHVLDGDVAADA